MAEATARATEPTARTNTIGATIFAFLCGLFASLWSRLSAAFERLMPDYDEELARAKAQAYEERISFMPILREVEIIGGAIILIAIIVVVVNAVLTTTAVANSTGPFSGVITTLQNTGSAALGLLVVGLLVVAAVAIMRFFRGGF